MKGIPYEELVEGEEVYSAKAKWGHLYTVQKKGGQAYLVLLQGTCSEVLLISRGGDTLTFRKEEDLLYFQMAKLNRKIDTIKERLEEIDT